MLGETWSRFVILTTIIRKRVTERGVEDGDDQGASMDTAEYQHFAWLARSFGRTDYLPLTPADLEALASAGTSVE